MIVSPSFLVKLTDAMCFNNFQDISHLLGSEEPKLVELPSGNNLKLRFNLKPKKSEAYEKLEESQHENSTAKNEKIVKSQKKIIDCNSCKNKSEGKVCDRFASKRCTFSNLPNNVFEGINTEFEGIEDSVCKELPTDTFDYIPKDTFDDIEVAIEDA